MKYLILCLAALLVSPLAQSFVVGGGSLDHSKPIARRVYIDNLADCIISKSGGGDSGGGLYNPQYKPERDPRSNVDDNRWHGEILAFTDSQKQILPEGFVEIKGSSSTDRLSHTIQEILGTDGYDLSFDVMGLLACHDVEGLPVYNLPTVLKIIDREIIFEKERADDSDYLQFLKDIRLAINAPVEV